MRSLVRGMLVGGVLLASGACVIAGAAPPAPAKAVGGKVVLSGSIIVVRELDRPMPQLTDEQGRRFLLTGAWAEELVRLHGHTVKVWGELGPKKLFQPTVVVGRYELLEVGGQTPQVGELRLETEGRLQLRQPERVLALEAPAALRQRLRARVGCKVWIVGELVGSVLRPAAFGWLRCQAAPAIDVTQTPGRGPARKRRESGR